MDVEALPVGAPLRTRIRTALVAAGGCAAACLLLSVLATQDKLVRAHSPWQDDPYDVVVSFSLLVLPALLAAGVGRVPSCRAAEALPATRARDLLGLARLLTAAATVCAVSEWAAVGSGAHAAAWGAQGWSLIAALGLVSVGAITAWVLVARVIRSPGVGCWRHAEGPDWVDDWMVVGKRLVGQVAVIGGLVEFLERRVVDGRWGVRRHPLGAAAVMAGCCGLAVAVAQAVGEHWPASLAAAEGIVLFTGVAAGGLFAFLVAAGSYLHLVRRPPAPPAPARLAVIHASVAAAASVPVTVAFRSLAGPVTDGLTGLAGAIVVVAALVWITVLIGDPVRRHQH